MRKILLTSIICLCFCSSYANKGIAEVHCPEVEIASGLADEEYERYKKRGDAYFEKGDYQNAIRQYRNCLEVPKFENDPYAKGQIELCQKLLKLREEAFKALDEGKGGDAVASFEQMLIENPKDSLTKVNLTDYWTVEADKLYKEQNYEGAIERYKKALKYAARPSFIEMQIQNSESFIKYKKEQAEKAAAAKKNENPEIETKVENLDPIIISSGSLDSQKLVKPKRRIGAKILAAVVGLGAGGYAYSLNNQYQTKLDKANSMGKTADPDGDNVILSSGEFNQWQTAYQAATAAKNDRSKFMASLGVAGAAAITEIILFALPKSKKTTGLSLGAATQSSGLAVRYIFK